MGTPELGNFRISRRGIKKNQRRGQKKDPGENHE